MPLMAGISVRRLSWREWSQFAPTWERVHNRCPEASFFLSRQWVDCWLATFGGELNPDLLAFVSGSEVVGCCLLVWRTHWMRGIPLRRVYLNCAGEDGTDSTFIEFNSLLSLPGYQEEVANSLATLLKRRYWDELLLPGVVEQDSIRILATSLGGAEVSESPARFIPLSRIREKRTDFLTTLSSKPRYNIRRSLRTFEELGGGSCTLRLAQSVDEAIAMLGELAELHQSYWVARGQPGCFSSRKFTSFHQRLIRLHFDRTLLFRLQAGTQIVGLLYCFVDAGWVYHYQSGISYALDSRMSPGLVTLSHVISYCLMRPELNGFDFMAGDSKYKRSLTADSDFRRLLWYTIRRRTVSNLLIGFLRKLKKKYAQNIEASRPPVQPPDETELGADTP
ncbi:MAG: GNAT family N-acetyltransferase [Bryobacteraceae bacterium]